MSIQSILKCNCSLPRDKLTQACVTQCVLQMGSKKNLERFTSHKKKEEQKKTILEKTMPVLKIIMLAYAIYLSFKCKQKVDPLDLSMAIFFSPCYILYRLALIDNQCEVPLFDKQ